MLKKLWLAALLLTPAIVATPVLAADSAPLAFPGAVGPAAQTVGGRGGKILRVTTLAPDGPGSLKEAIETPGPRDDRHRPPLPDHRRTNRTGPRHHADSHRLRREDA